MTVRELLLDLSSVPASLQDAHVRLVTPDAPANIFHLRAIEVDSSAEPHAVWLIGVEDQPAREVVGSATRVSGPDPA